LYNGQHEQTTQALVSAFEKQTGIQVTVRNGDEDQLAEQIVNSGQVEIGLINHYYWYRLRAGLGAGASALGGRYPHELSGGQQQRVAIARALAPRPRLVLLDEPFASLDASLRAVVRAEVLGALRAVGTTGVLVTHDQDEALSVADYVAVLRNGVITQAGPPREVYCAPADPWTAGFLGTANLLPGILQNQGVRTALGWHEMRAGGQLPDGGGEVTVLIRPEQIALAPLAPSAEGVTGKVTEARYHGHDALIAVDVGDAGVLQVRMLGAGAPAPGDEVCLTATGPVTAWPEGSF
jgi:iron(III) transport system ATP-binding protein